MIGGLFAVATMDWKGVGGWIEEHPYATGGIVFVGGLAVLWWLGYLGGSSGSSSASNGSANLAAAYYAAEAAQTTAGTQLQMETVADTNATAQVQIQANAATAINAANANASTLINGQNAGATVSLGEQDLLATQSNNATSLATVNSNNAFAFQTQQEHDQATNLASLINGILPAELAATGGVGAVSLTPGGAAVSSGWSNPNSLASQGFTQTQINTILGVGA
jgi:hypothetical protein